MDFLLNIWFLITIFFEWIVGLCSPFERKKKQLARQKREEEYTKRQQEEEERIARLPPVDWTIGDVRKLIFDWLKVYLFGHFDPVALKRVKAMPDMTEEEYEEWISYYAIIQERFRDDQRCWILDINGLHDITLSRFNKLYASRETKNDLIWKCELLTFDISSDLRQVFMVNGDSPLAMYGRTNDIVCEDGELKLVFNPDGLRFIT